MNQSAVTVEPPPDRTGSGCRHGRLRHTRRKRRYRPVAYAGLRVGGELFEAWLAFACQQHRDSSSPRGSCSTATATAPRSPTGRPGSSALSTGRAGTRPGRSPSAQPRGSWCIEPWQRRGSSRPYSSTTQRYSFASVCGRTSPVARCRPRPHTSPSRAATARPGQRGLHRGLVAVVGVGGLGRGTAGQPDSVRSWWVPTIEPRRVIPVARCRDHPSPRRWRHRWPGWLFTATPASGAHPMVAHRMPDQLILPASAPRPRRRPPAASPPARSTGWTRPDEPRCP